MSYHWRDGFFFAREENGNVTLTVPFEKGQIEIFQIPADEWCSIISSVSLEGENSLSYRVAQKFHKGE